MKQIKLTRGKFAMVDDCDYEQLSKYNWNCEVTKTDGRYYACRRGIREDGGATTVRMHRQIMGDAAIGLDVDHRDGDGLNNQRSNLRACTRSQNAGNSRLKKVNRSGYKGVIFDKARGLWYVEVAKKYVGRFISKEDAARAYNKKAVDIYGEFARLNDV